MRKESLGYVLMALGVVATVVVTVMVFMNNSRPPQMPDKPMVVVSIPPLEMLVREIAGDRLAVKSLLKAGDSPHTYSFKPSTRAELEDAIAFIYVGEGLEPWAASVDLKERHALLPQLPHKFLLHAAEHDHGAEEDGHDHDHGAHDPHFWLSIHASHAILPEITKLLSRLDPEGKAEYERNAEDFGRRLDALHDEIFAELKPLRTKTFVQFHPSFRYFMNEHLIADGGVVMLDPNVAPTAKHKADLLATLAKNGTLGIFIEPQFDSTHATKLAADAGVALIEVDPLGGGEGRKNYFDLIRWNTAQILKALPNAKAAE